MNFNRYSTLLEAERKLKTRGFVHSFLLMDSGQMKSIETDKTYQAEEMRIVEYHRFEGNSNPSDLSVIYAIYCKDGNKGTIVSTYGPYADMKLSVFMDKVKIIDPQNHNNGGR